MRVCMLAYTFYETDARVRRYSEELVRQGCEVDVVSLNRNSSENKKNINDVNVYFIQERKINNNSKYKYLLEVLFFTLRSFIFIYNSEKKYHYDIIHVHNIPDFLVFSTIISKLKGAKIILDIHDIVPEFYASKFNGENKSITYNALLLVEKLSAFYSDYVIVSNHIWEKKLVSRSVRPNNCSTIINYPDLNIFKPSHHELVKDKERFILLYPGSFSWHQGLDVAIKAMAILKDKKPDIDLHLYGDGPTKKMLEELVESSGLSKRVFFNASLPIEEITKKISTSNIGIVPKRAEGFGGEAFSTKIMEFMSLGVPVIASSTKIDRYYFNEKLVRFFASDNEKSLAEAIVELYENENLRNDLAENSLKFIKTNSWDTNKIKYLDIINNLGEFELSQV